MHALCHAFTHIPHHLWVFTLMWVHLPLSVSCFSQSALVSSSTWLTCSLLHLLIPSETIFCISSFIRVCLDETVRTTEQKYLIQGWLRLTRWGSAEEAGLNFFLILYWNGSLCVMGCIHNPPVLPGLPQTQTEPSALKKDTRKGRGCLATCRSIAFDIAFP